MAILPVIFTATYLQANNSCDKDDFSNPGMIICSQESLDKVDQVLNEQYKILTGMLSMEEAKILKSSQRDWITFKENYCTEVYNSVLPGLEAPIDRLSCLQQITSFRLSELLYLRTGVVADGFYKAVSEVSNQNQDRNYQDAIQFMAEQRNLAEPWSNYATKNCMLAQMLYGEDAERCMARMRFQTPID